jgi:SAM-dependent methyltransferase
MTYRELLIGCGHRRTRVLDPLHYRALSPGPVAEEERWQHVTAVDLNPLCKPDYVMDLERGLVTSCWPVEHDQPIFTAHSGIQISFTLKESIFAEVHAYEVLEHLGHQGNATEFFGDFDELWRVLRPGGWLCGTVPSRYSPWLWGDPGHRRAILPSMLQFLSRPSYQELGASPMSDYRQLFVGDWDVLYSYDNEETHSFVLQAVKPARLDP